MTLLGRRIVLTRPEGDNAALARILLQAGAEPIERPVIDIVTISGAERMRATEHLARALQGEASTWVFSSGNGVRAAAQLLQQEKSGLSAFTGDYWCVGPGTASLLREHGCERVFTPERAVAESLLDGIVNHYADDLHQRAVLLTGARQGRTVIHDGLRNRAGSVTSVALYDTGTRASATCQPLPNDYDCLVLASPSAARAFATLYGMPDAAVHVICIGPVTAQAAQQLGIQPVIAEPHTVEGIVRTLDAL